MRAWQHVPNTSPTTQLILMEGFTSMSARRVSALDSRTGVTRHRFIVRLKIASCLREQPISAVCT
jgi:hypothetical protein